MDSYRQFLEDFCPSHPVELTESESLTFRLQVFYLNDDDMDAECADWCHQYLAAFKCPWQLANQISLRAVDNMKKLDLSDFYEEMHDDDEPKSRFANGDNKDQTEKESEKKDEDEKKSPQAGEEEVGWSKLEFKEEKHAPRLMAELVAPLVFMEVRRVCNEMRENLPNIHSLPAKYETSSHAIRNTRRKMEDRHVVIPDLNDYLGAQVGPLTSFYAVYDGHGGVDGANYAASHLHHFLTRNKNYTTDLNTAILETYKQTDEEFIAKAKLENVGCGSTAVTAVFRDKTLYVTWLGDSQALLVRNGQPVQIMNPHKPEREDERQRIEALGGCVVWFGAWRVNGNLSVSRAIGDHEHKPFVGADPDMIKIDLEGNEDYLVLACDGLWDTLMPNALVELVQDHIKEHGSNRSEIAQLLIKAAKEQGSNDNITVIVVFLKDAAKMLETQSASESQSEKISENNNPEKGSDSKDPSQNSDDRGKDSDTDSKESDKDSGNQDKNPKEEDNKENETPLLFGILEISSESSDEVVILGSSDSVHMSGQGSDFNKDSSNNETSDEFIHAQLSSDSGQSPGQSGQGSRSGSGYQKPMIVVSSESGESESVSNGTSPNGSEEKQTTGTESHGPSSDQSLTRVDIHSNTSGTDVALMSKTASKCLSNRKAKRSKNGSKNGCKNGRNGHHNGHRHSGHHPKEGRRFSRGRINSTSLITYRTLSAPPRSRSAESDLALAQRNMLRSGDQIFEMLTGCSTSFIRKTSSSSKWTVAVEMEGASSLFPDNRLLAEDRRRSDTPQHYRKK